MRVACIQLSTGENYDFNCHQILKFIKESIKIKADLIITPEASTILSIDKKKVFNNSYSMNEDPFIKKIKSISKQNKKWILLGSVFIQEKNKTNCFRKLEFKKEREFINKMKLLDKVDTIFLKTRWTDNDIAYL